MVVLLGLVSLAQGWRWWHTLTWSCGWLAIGSIRWYHPSYWLADWPFFGSAHVVTRWRFVALLGLGLAAGSVLARWRRSVGRLIRAGRRCCVVVIAVDFVVLGHQQLPLAFSRPARAAIVPGPAGPRDRQRPGRPGLSVRPEGIRRDPRIRADAELPPRAPTLRCARRDPAIAASPGPPTATVRPVFWSPNRMVFQVEPGQEVFINQNPGSWWWVNGRPAFAGRRFAEPMLPFVARADDTGRLELRIHPRDRGSGSDCTSSVSGCSPRLGCVGPGNLGPERFRKVVDHRRSAFVTLTFEALMPRSLVFADLRWRVVAMANCPAPITPSSFKIPSTAMRWNEETSSLLEVFGRMIGKLCPFFR